MVRYLMEEEMTEINRFSLEATGEEKEIYVMQPDDIRFIVNFVIEEFDGDLYKKATAYCISIIVMHPFKNGNHRTSLLSAERFLIKNDFDLLTTNKEKIGFEKWRIKYEEKHDLERRFFCIAGIENKEQRKEEIKKIMNSEYGLKIEKWLKENFKQN